MLVGNAHPTVYQGFWRSKNAYFSGIQPKCNGSEGRNQSYPLRQKLVCKSLFTVKFSNKDLGYSINTESQPLIVGSSVSIPELINEKDEHL